MSLEIYLDHEDHGAQVAYSSAEAAKLEERGWKRRPKDWIQPKLRAAAEAAAEADEAPVPAKRGKKA